MWSRGIRSPEVTIRLVFEKKTQFCRRLNTKKWEVLVHSHESSEYICSRYFSLDRQHYLFHYPNVCMY